MSGQVIARLFVAGRPRTKGHMTPVHRRGTAGRPCTFGGAKDRPLLTAWMRTLNYSIQSQLDIVLEQVKGGKVVRRDAEPYAEPVEVHCFFRFDRVESEREAADQGEIIPSHATPWPTTIGIGDEDTLRRAVLDALVKSGAIADDRLSVGGMNFKRWCEAGEEQGVLIVVQPSRDPAVIREVEATMEGLR